MTTRLEQEEIAARLDELLEVEFSFRDTAGPAHALAGLPGAKQRFVLQLVERVASTNIELGYRLACLAAGALSSMDGETVEAWALNATDTYDRVGLRPALLVLEDVERFVSLGRARASGAVLDETAGVLTHFVRGLSGRPLKLDEGEAAYTDGETIYLPAALSRLPTPEENFALYKAMAAMLWAQTRFGTFRAPLSEALSEHPEPGRLLALFHHLETARLEARLAEELPGLSRQMERLKAALDEPAGHGRWAKAKARLARPEATSGDSLRLALELAGEADPPRPGCYQGVLRPDEVEARAAERIAREKALFRVSLRDLLEQEESKEGPQADAAKKRFSVRRADQRPDTLEMELLLDGKPVPPPEHVRATATSIMLDLGEIPPEYLVPAGPAEYDPALLRQERNPDEVWQGTYHEDGADLYNEWDYQRRHYRKNWCVVREIEVERSDDGFHQATLAKYSGLVRHLRKTFEAMRDEDRVLHRLPDGDDVDIDALVEALADARHGAELSDRVFSRLHRTERNIAVAFMVDMSGSTRGWINDAERESLLLLCEALETLGDRFAVYGFSGVTRKRCEIFRIKAFDEPYGRTVQERISGIRPRDYTRMGFAIRHLSRVLSEVEARTRILVTLSDGKPDDYSDYRGVYGIEDTRRALVEARRAGIHPYCITIDSEGPEYLPHMYGPAGFTVVDDVRRLPFRVADIYRRLTT